MPRMEHRQHWWNRFSSLICFRKRTQVSTSYRRVGTTTALLPESLWRGGASYSAIFSLTVFQRNCWLWTRRCQDPYWLWHRWGWCYPFKWNVPMRLGWCNWSWCEEDCMPLVEGVGTTRQSSSGCCWGRSSWLHQRSGWRCAVGRPPCGREGRSSQQTAYLRMSSSMVFMRARRRWRLTRLPFVQKRM